MSREILKSASNRELLTELDRRLNSVRPEVAQYIFQMLLPDEQYDPRAEKHQQVVALCVDVLEMELRILEGQLNLDRPGGPDDAIDLLLGRLEWLEKSLPPSHEEEEKS